MCDWALTQQALFTGGKPVREHEHAAAQVTSSSCGVCLVQFELTCFLFFRWSDDGSGPETASAPEEDTENTTFRQTEEETHKRRKNIETIGPTTQETADAPVPVVGGNLVNSSLCFSPCHGDYKLS